MTDQEFQARMAAVLQTFGIPTDHLADSDIDANLSVLWLKATFFYDFDELTTEQSEALHEVTGLVPSNSESPAMKEAKEAMARALRAEKETEAMRSKAQELIEWLETQASTGEVN